MRRARRKPMPDFTRGADRRRAGAADWRSVGARCRAAAGRAWTTEVASGFQPGTARRSPHRGATLVDIDLPNAGAAIPTYYLVATAEASSNLARYDGVRYGFRAPAERPGEICARMYRRSSRDGVRRRGQAAHHARHLRPERRLLRRVLPEGAAGADAHPARLRPRVRARRPGGDADQRRLRRSGLASASPIPSRCIWPTSSRSARIWPVCRRSACPCGFTREGSAGRTAADGSARSTKRRCCAPPTPTSATPSGRQASCTTHEPAVPARLSAMVILRCCND